MRAECFRATYGVVLVGLLGVSGCTVDTDVGRAKAELAAVVGEVPLEVGGALEVANQAVVTRRFGRDRWVVQAPQGSSFVRVHFERVRLLPGDRILVQDAAGTVADIIDESRDDMWSAMAFGDRAVVTLVAGRQGGVRGYRADVASRGYPEFVPSGFASPGLGVSNRSICGGDDKENMACEPSLAASTGRAVAKIIFTTSRGSSSSCTAWLVSADNLLMTNEHCVSTQSSADSVQALFNFERADCRGSTDAPVSTFRGAELLRASAGLDYALLRLRADAASTFGFIELEPRDATVGEPIYIIGHPGGRRKEVSVVSAGAPCAVDSVDQNRRGFRSRSNMGYLCDTERGSSGSPVFSATSNRAIALHHLGGCDNGGTYIRDIYPEVESFLGGGAGGGGGSGSTDEAPVFDGASEDTPLAIPDNDATGVASRISVPAGIASVTRVRAEVAITHTWRGDLVVSLDTPGGERVILANREGGNADDLRGTFDVTASINMANPMSGDWLLRVSDEAGQDIGTLDSWSLSLLGPAPSP